MDLKQLEIFIHVIDNASFTKAAEQLYMTQPTVSAHIAALERELDAQIVVRTTKEVHPSKVGQILYQYARQMVALRESAVQAVRGFERSMEGSVSIGASSIPSQYFLPELMSGFRAKYPEVSFQIHKCDSAQTVESLLAHKIEIGMTGTVIPTKKCVYDHFASDRLVVITPNTLKYQRLRDGKFPLRRLPDELFISREAGSGTRWEAEGFLREMGVDPSALRIVAELQDTESIKKSVAQGIGISIVSNCAAEDYRQFGKLLVFDFAEVVRPRRLYLVRHKSAPLSPVSQMFYEYALQHFER